ncbi:MAG: DsbA family oxidoreductase [Pseudomonadota bacterium]
MIKLDILSDPICPWCYIGKSRLDAALAERPDHPFVLEYHPFQLNPDMPAGGMDRRTYLEAKFGGKAEAARVYANIDAAARENGLAIDFGKISRTPNTLDAHRLIHWAGIEGRQLPVVDALFRAYFEEYQDIGDHDMLVSIAVGAGLDGAAIRMLLDGDADRTETAERDAHARARGVTGVPTHVIASRHVIPGAQPTEMWVKVIDDITEEFAAGAPE